LPKPGPRTDLETTGARNDPANFEKYFDSFDFDQHRQISKKKSRNSGRRRPAASAAATSGAAVAGLPAAASVGNVFAVTGGHTHRLCAHRRCRCPMPSALSSCTPLSAPLSHPAADRRNGPPPACDDLGCR